tara:strand:+ start:514 stop:1122 length:609 start_codon:yes stop_codon:yes gene_type:complete
MFSECCRWGIEPPLLAYEAYLVTRLSIRELFWRGSNPHTQSRAMTYEIIVANQYLPQNSLCFFVVSYYTLKTRNVKHFLLLFLLFNYTKISITSLMTPIRITRSDPWMPMIPKNIADAPLKTAPNTLPFAATIWAAEVLITISTQDAITDATPQPIKARPVASLKNSIILLFSYFFNLYGCVLLARLNGISSLPARKICTHG